MSNPNKPINHHHTMGSPISPLAIPTTTNTTTSGESSSSSSRPSHRRSASTPNPSSATSPPPPPLPTGNICPSGKITRAAFNPRSPDVLRSGSADYGHGSIVRKAPSPDPARRATGDPDEMRRVGNDLYRKGQFEEALKVYDRAITVRPEDAACRSNRAAALAALGMVVEAVGECKEALRNDPRYGRARRRLVGLYLRLGQVENARKHIYSTSEQPNPLELQNAQTIERHISKSMDARRIGDWKSVLRESDAAIAAGTDCSTLILSLRAEALLRLHRLGEADTSSTKSTKLEMPASLGFSSNVFGMCLSSYMYLVHAQVEMALGRFEDAEASAAKAYELDPKNKEVMTVLNNTRSVGRTRAHGNELFNSGKFADACDAYSEGLKFDPSNPVLYSNRAVCLSKLGNWERSIADCSEALKIHPNYTKALLRRAASYAKLERWAESIRDYEVLRKELPHDNDIVEALNQAQVAQKASCGMEVLNFKSSGSVEKVIGLEQLHAVVSLPGLSVVCFVSPSNKQCVQASLFMDTLQTRYPSISFLKVDIEENSSIAHIENVRIVPTFKIYKNGTQMKEMISPSQQLLAQSVRHYSSI